MAFAEQGEKKFWPSFVPIDRTQHVRTRASRHLHDDARARELRTHEVSTGYSTSARLLIHSPARALGSFLREKLSAAGG